MERAPTAGFARCGLNVKRFGFELASFGTPVSSAQRGNELSGPAGSELSGQRSCWEMSRGDAPGASSAGSAPSRTDCSARFVRSSGACSSRFWLRYFFLIFERMDLPIGGSGAAAEAAAAEAAAERQLRPAHCGDCNRLGVRAAAAASPEDLRRRVLFLVVGCINYFEATVQ